MPNCFRSGEKSSKRDAGDGSPVLFLDFFFLNPWQGFSTPVSGCRVLDGIWFAFAPTSLVFGFAPAERCGRGKCEPVVDMVFVWQAQEMSGSKHFRNGNTAAKKQVESVKSVSNISRRR